MPLLLWERRQLRTSRVTKIQADQFRKFTQGAEEINIFLFCASA
jgi:hypothetical protein